MIYTNNKLVKEYQVLVRKTDRRANYDSDDEYNRDVQRLKEVTFEMRNDIQARLNKQTGGNKMEPNEIPQEQAAEPVAVEEQPVAEAPVAEAPAEAVEPTPIVEEAEPEQKPLEEMNLTEANAYYKTLIEGYRFHLDKVKEIVELKKVARDKVKALREAKKQA